MRREVRSSLIERVEVRQIVAARLFHVGQRARRFAIIGVELDGTAQQFLGGAARPLLRRQARQPPHGEALRRQITCRARPHAQRLQRRRRFLQTAAPLGDLDAQLERGIGRPLAVDVGEDGHGAIEIAARLACPRPIGRRQRPRDHVVLDVGQPAEQRIFFVGVVARPSASVSRPEMATLDFG